MESERPNKMRRLGFTGCMDVYSNPPPTSPTGSKTPMTTRTLSSERVEMIPFSHFGGGDGSSVIKQQNPPQPEVDNKIFDEPGEIDRMIISDNAFKDEQLPLLTIKNANSTNPNQANMIIISEDEDDDSLFGSPPMSSIHSKDGTQEGSKCHNVKTSSQHDIIMISDDDDNDGSLFGDPSLSDNDIGDLSSKKKESFAGTDTPEAMSCELMPHQRLGLQWLLKHELGEDRGGVLADDMGLGKTIQALALIFANPPKDLARKTTLIVAPLALLQQWPREIDEKTKPGHKLRVHIYHGKGRQISVKQMLSYDVVLTNYDSLTAEFKMADIKKKGMILLDPDVRFHRDILDEAHNIKNRDTFAARGAFRLQADYRLAMTGTPLMNNSEELYSLMRFLDIPLYNEWEYFNRHIARPLNDASFSNSTLSLIAMRRINDLKTRTMLVRKKTDFLDGKPIISLPGRIDVIEQCTFDNDELAFYLGLQNQVKIEIRRFMKASRGDKKFSNLLVELLRLRQACCHPNLLASNNKKDDEQPEYLEDLDTETLAAIKDTQDVADDVNDSPPGSIDFSSMTREEIQALLVKPEPPPKKPKRKTLNKAEKLEYYRELEEDYQPSAKIRKTLEILSSIQEKDPQDKIIIFSFFTSFLDILAIGIRRAGFKFKRYDGTLNAAEKDAVIRDFTNPISSTRILITSLRSGNAGLNLNTANHVILEEPYWNPFVEQQAIDRAHRIGQTKHVYVHRLLVMETVEERITVLQEKKRNMVDIALGTGDSTELRQQREKIGGLTKEDVFDLLSPGLELPEGFMRDDVRDSLKLFSPTTKGTIREQKIYPATKSSGVPNRGAVRMPGRVQAASSVGPRRSVSIARTSLSARTSSTVQARTPVAVRPRFEASLPARSGIESPVRSSAKNPEDGPTDWTKLLAKHDGQGRRKF